MVSAVIEKELQQQLARLSPDQQQEVLEFARSLKKPRPKGG